MHVLIPHVRHCFLFLSHSHAHTRAHTESCLALFIFLTLGLPLYFSHVLSYIFHALLVPGGGPLWPKAGPSTVPRSGSLLIHRIKGQISFSLVCFFFLSLFFLWKKGSSSPNWRHWFFPPTPIMHRSRFSHCWRWWCLQVLLGTSGTCFCKSRLPPPNTVMSWNKTLSRHLGECLLGCWRR